MRIAVCIGMVAWAALGAYACNGCLLLATAFPMCLIAKWSDDQVYREGEDVNG